MKIVSKRQFAASPDELWEIIHEPGNMPAWNPKCVECESLQRYESGQSFSVVYEMNGKRTHATGELLAFEPGQMVHFRYNYEDSNRVGVVDEIFRVIPEGKQTTLLEHTVDFSQSHLPAWVKWLIGFLGRFGKKVGEGPMDGIAALLPEVPGE